MKHRINVKYGQLFVFEGPDDVGKSTLANMLCQHLSHNKRRSKLLSFPGNEPGTVGELIYRFYHNPQKFGISNISSIAMQLMVTAAHVDVIEARIKPVITAGLDVVLDRFWWSTWVYASRERVPPQWRDKMIQLEMQSWENIRPAIVFLVLRQHPFLEQPPNNHWSETLSLYEQLAEKQKRKTRIEVILNEGTIEEAFQKVVSRMDD